MRIDLARDGAKKRGNIWPIQSRVDIQQAGRKGPYEVRGIDFRLARRDLGECHCCYPRYRQDRVDQQRRLFGCPCLWGLLADAMRLGASPRTSLDGFGRRGRRCSIHGEQRVRVQEHNPNRPS